MLSNILVKYRYFFFAVVMVAIAGSVYFIPRLQFDSGFSQFLPKGDPELSFYQDFKAKMGDDERLLAIGIEADGQVFEPTFLKNATAFADSLRALPGVQKVSSLLDLEYPQKTPFGMLSLPYLHLDSLESLAADSAKVFRDFEMTQHFITQNGKALVLWVQLEADSAGLSTISTIERTAELSKAFSGGRTFLTGKKYIEHEYASLVKDESNDFVFLVTGFVLVILTLIFRSAIGVLLPLMVVVVSLVIFYGLMALTGRSLGVMSNLFPTVLLIVGISDIIHLTAKYERERQQGTPPIEAAKRTVQEIGWAAGLTTFTTAIGFLSFCTSSMPALRNFGLEAAAGVLLGYLVTIFLSPTIFMALGKKSTFPIRPSFANLTQKLFNFIERTHHYPKRVILFFALLATLTATGIFFINTNHLQLSNVPKDSDLKAGLDFFEEQAGGARTFELAISAKQDTRLNELPNLLEIRKLHLYLDSLGWFYAIRSPVTYYHVLYKASNPTEATKLALPEDDSQFRRLEKGWKSKDPRLTMLDKTKTTGRLSARLQDPGRKTMEARNADIKHWMDTHLDTSRLEFRLTGMDYLIDRGHQERIDNMLQGLWQSILIVAVLIALIYRSLPLILLVLIINLLPVVMAAGLMGFTGIELRGATSMVFSLGFMIAIDDTIHFLNKFRLERKSGMDVRHSVRNALYACGNAIVITNLILVGGFAVLMYSGFMEVFAYGELLGSLFFLAMFADLMLTQALILTIFKKYL